MPRTTKPRERTKRKPRADKVEDSPASSQAEPTPRSTEPDEDSESPDTEDGAQGERDGDGDEALAEGEAYPEVADDSAVPIRTAKAREATGAAAIERFDPLSAYLREVQRHPLLTPEETQALAEKFVKTQDSAAAARLVTANLRLVVKIAYEYRRAYKNIMDLIQEGNIGLMQAVKRYDPYRGVKLSSYAAWWIRAYILRFILNNWRLVKLGTTQAQRKLFFNLRKKRAELVAMGIEPTDAEIAKRLNVAESEVVEMDVRLRRARRRSTRRWATPRVARSAKVDRCRASARGPEALMADSELQGLLKEKLGTFRKTLAGKDRIWPSSTSASSRTSRSRCRSSATSSASRASACASSSSA